MPLNNRFRHQTYECGPPDCVVRYLQPAPPPRCGSEEYARRMKAVGATLRRARVAAIYLVHGTFLGPDALGVLADLSRVAPGFAETIRRWNKQVVDALAGDLGNFTRTYAESLENALNSDEKERIAVRLCHWSSENHHLGRADGAVRLIHELHKQEFADGTRVLLWGHSHAGNVFALMTNLLGSERAAREEFFQCARSFYRSPIRGRVYFPEWESVRKLVCEQDPPLAGLGLDLVTFGTPIRYGWDTGGYAKLLHFVSHRPTAGLAEHMAPFPPTKEDLLYAARGDIIQQIGIAGTNFAPPVWAWRAWLADVRLGKLFQMGCRTADVYARWQLGVRVHDEGENLLVDYGPSPGFAAQHAFGHAVYTRLEWQLFHAEEVAQRFYGHVNETASTICRAG